MRHLGRSDAMATGGTMSTTARDRRRGATTVAMGVAAALTGLVVALVLTLNLHIFAGVEDGYMATAAQVLERSVWILLVDVLLVAALPPLAVVLLLRLRRAHRGPS
jgi:hypothetical protein